MASDLELLLPPRKPSRLRDALIVSVSGVLAIFEMLAMIGGVLNAIGLEWIASGWWAAPVCIATVIGCAVLAAVHWLGLILVLYR